MDGQGHHRDWYEHGLCRVFLFLEDHPTLIWRLCWGFVALWFGLVLTAKIGLYAKGVVVDDVFMHANAILNTDFHHRLLYFAGYEVERGTTTLLQDHFEPSSLLIVPFYRLFDNPLFLIVLQGLAPLFLVAALQGVAHHIDGPAWIAPMVAVSSLYCPQFVHAVIDSLAGYRHDAQFLIYAPVFLFCLLTNRPVLTLLSLVLFLGVKQNAAFYTAPLGIMLMLTKNHGDVRRDVACAVTAISCVYFVVSVFVVPGLIQSPNTYAASGLSYLNVHIIGNAIEGFFHNKWEFIYLHFIYSIGSLPFEISSFLDIAMYSLMGRPADYYYDFNAVVFLAVGTLIVVHRLTIRRPRSPWNRFRRPLLGVFVLLTMAGIPVSLWEFAHIWRKSMDVAVDIPMAAKNAAWQLTDTHCTVAPQDSLSARFYRAPYLLLPLSADRARTLITIDPALLSPEARRRDLVLAFVEANAPHLTQVGRSGPLVVWSNPAVPCLPRQRPAPEEIRQNHALSH